MEKIRWGILAPGAIAHSFAKALRALPDADLIAVGSRSAERAKAFAKEYGIARWYEGYEDFASDPETEIVYVASPHPFHKEHTLLCLKAGKAVLCEKPFTMNEAELRELVDCARANGVFLMEAMWTRFLPALRKVREWLAAGAIGDAHMVFADFGFRATLNPESRLFSPDLGGGSLLDVGVYVVSFASMVMGERPERIASMADMAETGVDGRAGMILGYRGGKMAILSSAVQTSTPLEAWICGTEGSIHVCSPFWRATRAVLRVGGEEREVFDRPHKENGYECEAIEAMRCLREGRLESEVMPLDESLAIMNTLDRVRAQWGLKYPME